MESKFAIEGPKSAQDRPPRHHKRSKSASVLKGIISSKTSKSATTSADAAITEGLGIRLDDNLRGLSTVLPADHPHFASHHILSEIHNESKPASLQRPLGSGKLGSEKMLSEQRGSKKDSQRKDEKEKNGIKSRREKTKANTPKKSKSSTSLSSLFKNNRSSKDLTSQPSKAAKDKENTTPPGSSSNPVASTPIWAQFATQKEISQELCSTTKIPLNDDKARLKEIDLYTPRELSPEKRSDIHNHERPTLRKTGSRPKSMEIATATAKSIFQPIMRKTSQSRKTSNEDRSKKDQVDVGSSDKFTPSQSPHKSYMGTQSPQKGSRVMAAVATYNEKAKDAELEALLDPKNIDASFEAVLESRNIPEPMRQKMRTLKPSVKADFIRSHKVDGLQGSEISTDRNPNPGPASILNKNVTAHHQEAEAVVADGNLDDNNSPTTPKRPRPRSRTFTFNKGESSPSKKQKAESGSQGHRRTKSRDKSADGRLSRTSSSTSLARAGETSGSARPAKAASAVPPGDFIHYLHEKTSPQDVEVGRLHKLRLLLRNETVAWVDTFIREGGMTEILALLHRIMEIEWREDHEDALLHETLLCLKGLTTTDLALHKLNEVSETLFTSLLGMLFDKERKGPSEFTTRQIVINLLFAHLSSAPPELLPARARTILSFVQDKSAPETNQPLAFVMDMRQPRPYRTWNKEIVDVTKEVFWIFLHQMNVISLPTVEGSTPPEPKVIEVTPSPVSALSGNVNARPSSSSTGATLSAAARPTSSRAETAGYSRAADASYTTRHFPPQRPPVPAAPYVGGVEWDATNYLAAHLDLLNGVISALPTLAERNELRSLLRASGMEKIMGATLRTCKEKFYGAVHAGLRTWVGAASEDGWDVADVRFGPREEDAIVARSVRSSPTKKKEAPPKLELPVTQSALLGSVSNGGSGLDGKDESGAGADRWTFDL